MCGDEVDDDDRSFFGDLLFGSPDPLLRSFSLTVPNKPMSVLEAELMLVAEGAAALVAATAEIDEEGEVCCSSNEERAPQDRRNMIKAMIEPPPKKTRGV